MNCSNSAYILEVNIFYFTTKGTWSSFKGLSPESHHNLTCPGVPRKHPLVGLVFIWPDLKLVQCEQTFLLWAFGKTISGNCLIPQQSEVVIRIGANEKLTKNLKGKAGKKRDIRRGFWMHQISWKRIRSHACAGLCTDSWKNWGGPSLSPLADLESLSPLADLECLHKQEVKVR